MARQKCELCLFCGWIWLERNVACNSFAGKVLLIVVSSKRYCLSFFLLGVVLDLGRVVHFASSLWMPLLPMGCSLRPITFTV